jgi:hypothetical protein
LALQEHLEALVLLVHLVVEVPLVALVLLAAEEHQVVLEHLEA